jgi:hypothetical protein
MSETVQFERSHDIVIDAPPAAVLAYVSNPNSWPEWMPATHHIDAPDRPLAQGEQFFEKWATRQGEVALDWAVSQRSPTVWEARTETAFTGPIIARYTVEAVPGGGARYTRTVINPARPKAPTPEMVQRMDDEAAVCLANIKRNVEARSGRAGG